MPLLAEPQGGRAVKCPAVKIEAQRLPDLNVPRSGHVFISVDGEPTLIGGHTTNFVPTATIEYYKNDAWHVVPSAFTHDDGFAVVLTSGKVLIGGGHERNLGIGQSFEVELYDPVTHTCEGFSSLDTKRSLAAAVALDGNRALITGNWHHDDAIEMYDGKEGFVPVKSVSCGRAMPYILRTAKDDAIIFTSLDSEGILTPHPLIERLHGEAYREPLLEEWGLRIGYEQTSSTAFIGDEAKGDYSYLLLVENAAGQVAIARVTNGEFSILPTDVPIPMSCEWGVIAYGSRVFADRQNRRAYLLGTDTLQYQKPCDSGRIYVITIDYAQVPAQLTLCYTDILNDYDIRKTVMTPDGDLMLAGGHPKENNFKPTAATWLLHVTPDAQKAASDWPWRGWTFILLAVVTLLALLYKWTRRTKKALNPKPTPTVEKNSVADTHLQEDGDTLADEEQDFDELMAQICQVMEDKALFLNPNLKVSDVANILGSNRTSISNCINTQRGCSFPQFVNAYRIDYAQELMRNQPDMKLAEVCTVAGFSSEASFYRIFKTVTGLTPADWKNTRTTQQS